ncbi:MAG: electron transfer flavoprotein subunit beta/FixA family protein [Candidatus Margulisbacteria bacterium]|nr:electron transfer flavoprotein subunit beta/FixA family protein [Candidatus Margulisiibacteriota bacterium]
MNIAVCIKQVPDSDKVTIDRETNRLNRTGVPSVINPFDENAIELGLQLKDKHGGKVTVITMGPPQAEQALRDCIAVGADEAYLITDRKFAGADTWATSYTLSLAVQKAGDFDVVLFGKQAIDGDTAQVGPGVAYFMDIPVITYVKEVEKTETGFKVKRVTEEGYQLWEVDGKAAFTVVKEANTMRLPSLKGKMRAKSATITTWGADDIGAEEEKIGLKGSPTIVRKVFSPPIKTNREIIENEDPKQSVKELLGKLKERKIL